MGADDSCLTVTTGADGLGLPGHKLPDRRQQETRRHCQKRAGTGDPSGGPEDHASPSGWYGSGGRRRERESSEAGSFVLWLLWVHLAELWRGLVEVSELGSEGSYRVSQGLPGVPESYRMAEARYRAR